MGNGKKRRRLKKGRLNEIMQGPTLKTKEIFWKYRLVRDYER